MISFKIYSTLYYNHFKILSCPILCSSSLLCFHIIPVWSSHSIQDVACSSLTSPTLWTHLQSLFSSSEGWQKKNRIWQSGKRKINISHKSCNSVIWTADTWKATIQLLDTVWFERIIPHSGRFLMGGRNDRKSQWDFKPNYSNVSTWWSYEQKVYVKAYELKFWP